MDFFKSQLNAALCSTGREAAQMWNTQANRRGRTGGGLKLVLGEVDAVKVALGDLFSHVADFPLSHSHW